MDNLIAGEINIVREDTNYPPNTAFTPVIVPSIEKSKMRFFMPALYLILGVFLLSMLRTIFDVYVLHLKIETAVVSVPLETIIAPTAGLIREIYVTPGQNVKKGAPLLKIENIDLERDLQLARIQAEDSKRNIDYLRNLLTLEQQHLNLFKNIGSSRVESAQAVVNELKHELKNNKKQLKRMQLLARKHYVSDMELDEAQYKYHSTKERMKAAMALKDAENHSLNAVDRGVYFTGSKLEGLVGDLNAQIIDAQNKLKLNEDRVKVYENILSKLTLLSPFDGRVTQVLKTAGTTTNSINPILLLEQQQSQKKIIAYLTQNEITHVGSMDKVKIYIPSTGKTYHGKVVDINRTSGFVDEVNAQYRWRDVQIDRSAMVTIDLDHDQNKFNQEVTPGVPALVYFPRKFTAL